MRSRLPRKKNNSLKFKKLFSLIYNQNKKNNGKHSYSEMKKIIRNRNLTFILKILSAANILVVLIIASLFYLNTENKNIFNKQILEIDRSINNENFTEAGKIIRISSERANTKTMALMIMKRGFEVSENISEYKLLFDLSEYFYNSFKRDKRIRSVYLYSLLKTGRIDEFFNIFSISKKNDSFNSDLLLEGYSKYLASNKDLEIDPAITDKYSEQEVLFSILQNPEDSENYLKAYNAGNSRKLLDNLILLNLKKGRRVRALEFTVKRGIQDYLSALVFLDNGRFHTSRSILTEISDNSIELTLIRGDLEMYMNRDERSRIIYKTIMESDPLFSPVPLINLIWLDYEKQGTIDIDLFAELLKNYPESRYNNILFYLNLKKETGNLPDSIISEEYNDLDEYLVTGNNNNSRLLNLLWSIYNNSVYSADYKDYFAFYLYKNRFFRDLKILLEKNEYRNSSHYYFFNFLLDILDNNFSDAEKMLKKYMEMHYNFEIIYDLALINIYYEDYSSALEYFNMITGNDSFMHNISKKRLSDIYFKTAYSHYKKKNYHISYKLLNRSISLDRGNIKPQFLLKYIKSKIVEQQ